VEENGQVALQTVTDDIGNERGKPDLAEIGATGATIYGNLATTEYNPDLRDNRGTMVYDKMRRGDGQVRAVLRLVKSPISSANWYVQPASDDPLAIEQADFIEWAFQHIGRSMVRFLWEALTFLDYGYYAFEKVFTYDTWTPSQKDLPGRQRPRPRQVVRWAEFAARHPMTVEWFDFDDNGRVTAMQHARANFGSRTSVSIPIDKLILFTLDEEAGDPRGISILRSAYKHWYYKDNLYKIDAIQKERHGIGIPIITLPPNYSEDDKRFANEIGRNLRTNEKAHVVLPPGFVLDFAELRTNLVDALKSAEHHDLMIARNVLGQFINLGSHGGSTGRSGGASAVGNVMEKVFNKSLRYVADLVRQQVNKEAVEELINLNYGVQTEYPTLRVRRLDEGADLRALSVAYRNFVESNSITTTPEDEEWLREQMDMPIAPQAALDRTAKERIKQVPTQPALTAGGNRSSERANKAKGDSRSGRPLSN
jgi:hypothetical protein